MGRSGTRFLAKVMNRSEQWRVVHEPAMFSKGPKGWRGHPLLADADMVAARFRKREYYGEVNGYLRHVLLDLPVDRRGVILRHPHDILVSAFNWSGRGNVTRQRLDIIALGFHALDRALAAGVSPIFFEQMTTDATYLQQVFSLFGITDVVISAATLAEKVNEPKTYRIREYAEIPAGVRRYYDRQTDWYRKKYYAKDE